MRQLENTMLFRLLSSVTQETAYQFVDIIMLRMASAMGKVRSPTPTAQGICWKHMGLG